jgi:hypothetical protein
VLRHGDALLVDFSLEVIGWNIIALQPKRQLGAYDGAGEICLDVIIGWIQDDKVARISRLDSEEKN